MEEGESLRTIEAMDIAQGPNRRGDGPLYPLMRCLPAIPLLLPSLSLSLQYQLDMNYMAKHKSEDVYSSFNLIRR